MFHRLGKKIFVSGFLTIIVVLSFLLVQPGQTAHAATKHTECSPSAASATTTWAGGSTSAYVSITLWQACDGGWYASANSFSDGSFAFHGTVSIGVVSDAEYGPVTCNYAGICNSGEIYPNSYDTIYGTYVNNNGVFYRGYIGVTGATWDSQFVTTNNCTVSACLSA